MPPPTHIQKPPTQIHCLRMNNLALVSFSNPFSKMENNNANAPCRVVVEITEIIYCIYMPLFFLQRIKGKLNIDFLRSLQSRHWPHTYLCVLSARLLNYTL